LSEGNSGTTTFTFTVTLSADLTQTGVGMPVVFTWSSTHAQTCTATGEWSGTLANSGTQTVTMTSLGNHIYGITCSNPGSLAAASVTVTALAPTLNLSAFPANVALGKPVTLRWRGQYATGCVASGDWTGSLPAAGYQTVLLSAQGMTHYHLVCSSVAGSDQKDATVIVGPAPAVAAATTYRMNEAHNGVLLTSNGVQYPSQSAPTWTRDMGAPVSYPLIVNGKAIIQGKTYAG